LEELAAPIIWAERKLMRVHKRVYDKTHKAAIKAGKTEDEALDLALHAAEAACDALPRPLMK
jgi:hypothetical protein